MTSTIDIGLIRQALGPLPLSDHELRDLAHALESPPRSAIRTRPGVDPASLPFPSERVRWHANGYFVPGGTRPAGHLRYATGDYYIQDVASLLAITALDAGPGERVCDLCAAPGGKATAILEAMGDDGWLLANETIRNRLGALRVNLARHGSTRFAVCQRDPELLANTLGPVFDAVLVDAPCSGQSLLGRSRQTASAFSAKVVGHNATRQARILDAAARLVRPQGRLVYSTCTFSYRENEGQIRTFLDSHPDFELEPREALAAWESESLPGSYRLWPQRDACGGAFAAALRNGEGVAEPTHDGGRRLKTPLARSQLPAELAQWGDISSVFVWSGKDRLFAWTEDLWPPLRVVCGEGPEISFRKGRTWFPAYALAMRRDPNWISHTTAPLTNQEAADYLHGLPITTGQKGWVVATWNGRPLGWLKGDGVHGKNHLPKPARLSCAPAANRP